MDKEMTRKEEEERAKEESTWSGGGGQFDDEDIRRRFTFVQTGKVSQADFEQTVGNFKVIHCQYGCLTVQYEDAKFDHLIDLLRRGIGVHHPQLSPKYRQVVLTFCCSH